MINLVGRYGIHADIKRGLTGVWVNNAKIAAIGIKLRRWVTMHGVSINVDPDLRYFDNIVPCGIADADKSVGTLKQFNAEVSLAQVAKDLIPAVEECFQVPCRVSTVLPPDILGMSGPGEENTTTE